MNFYIDTKLLKRFLLQVQSQKDTPSLIKLIAGDAGYLMLCRDIVNDSPNKKQKRIKPIKAVCRKQGLDLRMMQQKLNPAARALGLISSSNLQLDYYELLEVSAEANSAEIKKAFRKKVYEVHPDTSDRGHADNDKFIKLKAVYETLSDPVLRGHYDLSRRNLNRWHETPMPFTPTDRVGREVFFLQLVALIALLVLGIFFFDFLVP